MSPQSSPPISATLQDAVVSLLARRRADGGFAETDGGDYRPDATAWAILSLDACRTRPEVVAGARAKLGASQLANGSIPVTPDYPEAFWPTAIAALALHGEPQFAAAHDKAIAFLLTTSGRQIPEEPDSPIGHDSMIPGWAWIDQTHSWVEPTAMAIRALTVAGKSTHERVRSGIELLLDRQLPTGGWNYGNTTVFGKVLRFMPAATGIALWALAGLIERKDVAVSLALLSEHLPRLRTPLSLGWALHGLAAWEVEVPHADELIANCLRRQGRYGGGYGTSQLGVLLAVNNKVPSAGGSRA